LKSILTYYPNYKFTPNEKAQFELIIYLFNWQEKTLFNEISLLEPRQELIYDFVENKIDFRYYSDYPKEKKLIDNEVIEKFHEKFVSVINNFHLEGKKCIWFSGGLDSRVILASCILNNIQFDEIINFGKKRIKDYKYAMNLIHHYNLEKSFTNYEITPDIIIDRAVKHLWITEGYSGHLNSHLSYYLEKFDEAIIMFDGFCGDLILGGNHIPKVFTNSMKASKYNNLKLLKRVINPKFHEILDSYNKDEINSELLHKYSNKDPLKINEFIFQESYPRRKVKFGGIKIGEDYGIVHYPFFYQEIFEACIELPIDERRNHLFYNKWIETQFKSIKDYPSTTHDTEKRKKRNSLFYRGIRKINNITKQILEFLFKRPFSKSERYNDPDSWLRISKDYYSMITTVLFSKRTANRGIFQIIEIEKLLKEHIQRKANYGFLFAQLFDAEIIFRLFYDRLSIDSIFQDLNKEEK
jgi:asparagine synthetase B (glutamine-hydrolysing)